MSFSSLPLPPRNKHAVVVPSSVSWLQFAIVALDSFVRAVPNPNDIDLCLLVSSRVQSAVRDIVQQANLDFEIQVHGFDSAMLSDYHITSRWSEVSWYKTTLPSLPEYESYERILLMGVDVYCTKINTDIFTSPLTCSIGAVREPRNSPTYQYPPFNEATSRYFNADVLLYNCNQWQLNGESNKIRQASISSNKPCPFADQDVLNHYFKENWDELPLTFNWIPALNNLLTYRRFGTPSIVQWAGKWKPWDSALVPPLGMTRQWRKRYNEIWNRKLNFNPELSIQGLARKKPLRAVLAFYAPLLLPIINLAPRIRDKFRLIRKIS